MTDKVKRRPTLHRVVQEVLPPEPPMPELIGWCELPDGRLHANEVRNHPIHGNYVGDVLTSTVTYLSRELCVAQTRNTTYRLINEEPFPS